MRWLSPPRGAIGAVAALAGLFALGHRRDGTRARLHHCVDFLRHLVGAFKAVLLGALHGLLALALESLRALDEDGARPIAVPAAAVSPNIVNATTTAASTTPTPCGVIEIMANSVATT